MRLNRTTLSLGVGNSVVLKAVVEPEDATNVEITWSSSDPGIATVDQGGTVTAIRVGSVIITAPVGEIIATCDVTVTESSGSGGTQTQKEEVGANTVVDEETGAAQYRFSKE